MISRIVHSRGRPVAQGFGKCGATTRHSAVGQIGLVSGNRAAMLLSSSRRPHGETRLVRENLLGITAGANDTTLSKIAADKSPRE